MNVGRLAELEDVQAAIADVRERLRVAIGARDRFIAHVSHELKTPIAIILTEAQTLDTRTLSPDARIFVRSVIDEMRRLGRTIESFLTLTKVRAGASLMDVAPCDVADIVMDAVLGCSRMARQHKVSLNPLLADSDHPVAVNGDAELLLVLVDHLLRYAIKASPEGAQVIIHVSDSVNECVIAVRDFGPPLIDSTIPPAFDPTPPANGTPPGRRPGMGLSIAQTVAKLHSGAIDAHALPDGGCEVAVRLPKSGPSAPPAQP
jgi:signal transduction histidine kinase